MCFRRVGQLCACGVRMQVWPATQAPRAEGLHCCGLLACARRPACDIPPSAQCSPGRSFFFLVAGAWARTVTFFLLFLVVMLE